MDKSRKRPKNTSFEDLGSINKRKPTYNPSPSLLSTPPSSLKTAQAHTIKPSLSIDIENHPSKDNNGVVACHDNNEEENIFKTFTLNATNSADNLTLPNNYNDGDIDKLSEKIINMKPFSNGTNANVDNEVDGNANAIGSINPHSNIIKSNTPMTTKQADMLESQTTTLTTNIQGPTQPTLSQDDTLKTSQDENIKYSSDINAHTGGDGTGEIYSTLENISKDPLNASELEQLNKNGLWWNYFRADKRGLFLRLTPENILVNYIFQSKTCCAAFYNDDLFNYLTFNQLFLSYVNNFENSASSKATPMPLPSLSSPNEGLDGAVLEVNNDELMARFSSTTYNELFMRALLIATETKIELKVPVKLEIGDMREYENLSNGKIIVSGEVDDWCKLKNLLKGLRSRCELVIKHTSHEQATRLININERVSNLVEQVIEHKLGVLDGKLCNDMLWYHYDTFEFSGLMCDLALTTTFKHGRNIHINTILSECAKLQLHEEDTPFGAPEYDIVMIAKQNTLCINGHGDFQVLDSELSVFKTK